MYIGSGTILTYQGKPIIGFPYWANYRKNFIDRWEWKTDVLTAYNGDEQRRCLRSNPRRSFEFEIFCRGEDRSALEQTIWKGGNQIYAVPDWNRGLPYILENFSDFSLLDSTGDFILDSARRYISISAAASPGYIPVTLQRIRISPIFFPTDYVLCFLSPSQFTVRKIVNRSQYYFDLDEPTYMPIGTMIYPALLGNLPQEVTVSRQTPEFTYANVNMNLFASSYALPEVEYPSYLGYPVVEENFDWSQVRDTRFSYKVSVIDYETADAYIDTENPAPSTVQPLGWFLNSDEVLTRFFGFLGYSKGRAKPFWVSTGAADLTVTAVTSDRLIVKATGYIYFSFTSFCKHLRIEVFGRAPIYCKVTEAAAFSSTEYALTLNIDPDYAASDIMSVSFLMLSRNEADRIEVAYRHPRFATCTTQARTLNHDL